MKPVIIDNERGKKCSCCHIVNPDPRGKQQALRAAAKALAKMKTPGWSIRIFHNISWVWSLDHESGFLWLYPSKSVEHGVEFSSLLGDNPAYQHAGCPKLCTSFFHPDPNKVVEHQMLFARERIEQHLQVYMRLLGLCRTLVPANKETKPCPATSKP